MFNTLCFSIYYLQFENFQLLEILPEVRRLKNFAYFPNCEKYIPVQECLSVEGAHSEDVAKGREPYFVRSDNIV